MNAREKLRPCHVGIRMSPLERSTLQRVAQKENLTISALIRRLVTKEAARGLIEGEGNGRCDEQKA